MQAEQPTGEIPVGEPMSRTAPFLGKELSQSRDCWRDELRAKNRDEKSGGLFAGDVTWGKTTFANERKRVTPIAGEESLRYFRETIELRRV